VWNWLYRFGTNCTMGHCMCGTRTGSVPSLRVMRPLFKISKVRFKSFIFWLRNSKIWPSKSAHIWTLTVWMAILRLWIEKSIMSRPMPIHRAEARAKKRYRERYCGFWLIFSEYNRLVPVTNGWSLAIIHLKPYLKRIWTLIIKSMIRLRIWGCYASVY